MEGCIFCGIVEKRIPSKVVYEDEKNIGILDIQPKTKGMVLLIPKKHFSSFLESPHDAIQCFSAALKVGEALMKALSPKEIVFSIIPSEKIKHFHIRVYPVYDIPPLLEKEPLNVSEKELDELAELIRGVMKVEMKESEEEVIGRSEEVIYRIKRDLEIA